MKILITGSTGLLGQALIKRLAPHHEVTGLSRHPSDLIQGGGGAHHVCDLTDPPAVGQLIRTVRPDAVIHAQAYSDVDGCEREPERAERLNVRTVEALCRALDDGKPLLIAISTDYVFDGTKASPYDEQDATNPISVYGKTKLAGERIALAYPNGVVVRPSTLFGPARMNFCDAIVQRLSNGEPIEAFLDQTTSPTYTEDLACGLARLLEVMDRQSLKDLPRVYHMTNAGCCTRVEFAACVAALLGHPASRVRSIRMQDQRRPAPRPAYSALTSQHPARITGGSLRRWDEAVRAYLVSRHWLN